MADDGRSTAAPGADTAGVAPVVTTAVPAAVAAPPWPAATTSPVSPFATAASLAQAAARAGPAPGALGALGALPTLPTTAAQSFASHASVPERTLKSTLAAAVARHELGTHAAYARVPPLGNDATMKMDRTSGSDAPESASDDDDDDEDAELAAGANRAREHTLNTSDEQIVASGSTPSKTLLPPGVPPPAWMLDAAWANHSPAPMDAAADGVAAAREAWICCDAADCGKWRRVPAVVARALGEGDEWRCSENRDARFAGCRLPQELGDDEIDRRVNAAAAAEREVLLAEAEAERIRARDVEKREKKRKADQLYRDRKRARKAQERRDARVAAGLPPDSPPRPPPAEKKIKAEKKVKAEKPPPAPPPPPPPPTFYPLAAIRCESESCGKWRRVSRAVANANAGPRKRWVCAFNAAAPFEQRSCAFPQEWADDDALRRWRIAHAHEEAEARALGAVIDGEEDPTAACVDSQKAGGKKNKNASAASRAPRRAPIAAGETEEQARRRRAEAGIKEDLPRGEVSGFAAEAMCAEDEEAHDDPNRKEGAPRTMPPPLPRGEPAAAVPVRCGGVAGVFLTRRAAFRCMCDSALENCASRSGVADGNVMTTTAFERHCGMEKSKNWRTSVAVVCSDRPVGLKIGQWLDEVGVDVARGKGGGPGAESSKESSKKKEKDKHKANERLSSVRAPDTRWQPETPGPMEDLPLRFLMDAIRLAGPGDEDEDDDEELSGDEESPESPESPRGTPTRNASRAERRRFLARLCVVSKTWACASKTVTKTSGWDAWRPTGRSLAEISEAERDENANENARGEKRSSPAKNFRDGSIPEAVFDRDDDAKRRDRTRDGPREKDRDPEFTGELGEAERASLAKREARREKDRERRRREGYVDRKFEVDLTATRAQLEAITEYVPRGDPEEVARERTVTLAPEQPKVSASRTENDANASGSRRPPHVAAKHPGDDALDRRVRVFWPEEKAYFLGMVTAFDASTGEHVVTYDDGDVESVVLAKETFEWLEPNGAFVADPSLPSLAPTIDPVTGDVSDPSKPPGWWPVAASWPLDPATGKQQRRKRMGEQVREQETYGVDYVTARDVVQTFKRVCPEWDDDALWRLCDALMAQVNASYGFLPIDTAATQSLALAAEDKASTLERDGLIEKDGETRAFARAGAKALWALAADARLAPEMFAVHRKGFGVTCLDPNGVSKGDLVVDFLGEMYPPWAWAEKQDAIKAAQKLRGMKESGPPEFYNMQLERPAGDAEGFALLFVDAMHHNNYAARLSHSCDPNVEVSLRAIDGKYCINFYAKRDVRVGEELCYNYHSCTDSMKEVEAAFCLCGARRCRASYLAFVGEQSNNQVLTRCHRLVERHAALFSAGDASSISTSSRVLSPAAIEALESIGLRPGRGLLRDVPDWLVRYVGSLALFMSTELKRLPRDILDEHRASTAKEVRRSGGSWKPPPFGLGDAEIEALSVRENRAQSVAICLSKVRYLLGRGAEEGDEGRVARRKSAPPPFRAASETDFETRAKFFGAHRDALVRVLLQSMAPHARHGDAAAAHAAFAAEVNEVAAKVCGSGRDSDPAPDGETVSPSPNEIVAPTMSLREGLLWLRDRLASMPVTPGARHDIAADLVHLCACTRRRFAASASPSHAAMRGEPVAVRENEVCSFGIGAEGASAKIVKKMDVLYKPHAAAFSLLMWYKQDASDPAQYVNSNRRGCVTLPDVNCAYSPRPEVPVARAGAEERDAWLRLMRTNPGAPWPLSTGPWGVSNAQRLMGSPALDAFVDAHENGWGTLRGGEPATEDKSEDPPRIDDATLEWLEKRPRNAT